MSNSAKRRFVLFVLFVFKKISCSKNLVFKKEHEAEKKRFIEKLTH